MLKFEGKFQVGDVIKAYSFQPMPDRPDSYIIGQIVGITAEHGFKAYQVVQQKNIMGGEILLGEVGTPAWVPMEVSFGEHDDRIQKIA